GRGAIPMSGVQLSQLYGIELADFACETARLSLWISEYQMNEQFKAQFGVAPPALPLRDSGTIVHGNSLRVDWSTVCPPDPEKETYVVGNPPYLGSVQQTEEQKEDMLHVFAPRLKTYKDLDFVAAFFIVGAEYAAQTGAQIALVSTNSICQGEQVGMLWPLVGGLGIEISFAHLSFKWSNSAARNAAVVCVVIGLRQRGAGP